MKIFSSEECATAPRADMFLPDALRVFGFSLLAAAAACLIAALVTRLWGIMIGFVCFGALAAAVLLCWKNQAIRIIDDNSFEYTTFSGRKTVYSFSEITDLRVNPDSFTLFVGDTKVHIEAIANISTRLIGRIDEALEKNGKTPALIRFMQK